MNRRLLALGSLFLALSSFAARSAAAADSVRVIAAQAAIHLNADPGSVTIATVPAGTVMELNAKQGDWYAVWLTADAAGGPRRFGFLAASDAELMPDNAPRQAPVRQEAPPPPEPPMRTPVSLPESTRSRGDFDMFGGATFKLSGARAIVSTGAGTVDSGDHSTLPTFGITIGGWLGRSRIFGLFVDFSGVDGGSATAQIGSSMSQVSSSLVDLHVGWQVQAPGRIRPYAFVGTGVSFIKNTGSLTLFGTSASSVDDTQTRLSSVGGVGVRIMATENWGIKVGVDVLAILRSPADGGELDYGRFIGGAVYSFK